MAIGYDSRQTDSANRLLPIRFDPSGTCLPIAIDAKESLVSVTDSGMAVIDISRRKNRFLMPDGARISFPVDESNSPCRTSGYLSADPRFQAIAISRDKLAMYDLQTQRVIASINHDNYVSDDRGILFHQDDRFLLVPRQGQVTVLLGDAKQRLLGEEDTVWRWSEDGSVWSFVGQTMKIVRWRSGDPSLLEVADPKHTENWISDLCDEGHSATVRTNDFNWGNCPAWACAWQDGALLARADMVDTETRRLALIRDGACIGTFDIPLHTPSQKTLKDARAHMNMSSVGPRIRWRNRDKYSFTPSLYREHLAFSADGRYLTWLIDSGTNTIECYLFAVGDVLKRNEPLDSHRSNP